MTFVRTRSWQEIVAHYDDLVLLHHWQIEPMRALVTRLAASPAAAELYSATSMDALLISNAPNFPWGENVLRVAYLPDSAEFAFSYSQYSLSDNITLKRCSVFEAWDTLSTFLRYKFGELLPNDRNA